MAHDMSDDQFHLAKSSLMSYTSKANVRTYNIDLNILCLISFLFLLQLSTHKDPMKTLQQKDYLILKGCAQGYILFGKSLTEMCDHNENVAKKLGKNNVAMLWSFVKIMYSSSPKHQKAIETGRNLSSTQNLLTGYRMINSTPKSITSGWCDDQSDVKLTNNHHDTVDDDYHQTNDSAQTKHGDYKPTTGPSGSQLVQSSRSGGVGGGSGVGGGATTESSSDALNNFVHGDAELTVEHMDYIKSFRNGFLYIGPHDLSKNFSIPNQSMMNHDMHQTPHSSSSSSSTNQIVSKERRNTSPVRLYFFASIRRCTLILTTIPRSHLRRQLVSLKSYLIPLAINGTQPKY